MQSDCLYSSLVTPYSLNTTIAFYVETEYSNIAVSVWLMACHVATHSHFIWTRPVLELAPYFCNKCYMLGNNSVKNASVTLWFCL